jgi:hypothetical protein
MVKLIMLKDDSLVDETGQIPRRIFCLLSIKIFNHHGDQLRTAQNRKNMIPFNHTSVFSDGNMQKICRAEMLLLEKFDDPPCSWDISYRKSDDQAFSNNFLYQRLNDTPFSCNFSHQKPGDPTVSSNISFQKSDDQAFSWNISLEKINKPYLPGKVMI